MAIIASVVLIQTALLAILIWTGLQALSESNEAEFLKRSATTVRLFSSAVQTAVVATDLGTLERASRDLMENPNVAYVRIYGNGHLLIEKGAPAALDRRFVRDSSLKSVRDKIFDEMAEINIAGQRFGHVEIGFSVDGLSGIVRETRNRFMVLAAANLVLIVAFASMLGLLLTSKLQALRVAAARISKGEFGYQIRMRGRDELARTADAFNAMSIQLKHLDEERGKAEAEMRALNEDLERRVKLRTHELTDLTQELNELNRELQFQALHDELTRLPNRTLFNDRLQQAINAAARDRRAFALVSFDLDRFKEINDTLGHYAGDVVLMEVAKRSRAVLRRSDTVARMGGDEFSILLGQVGHGEDAVRIVLKIHEAICGPFFFDGHKLEILASMGVAIYGEHGDSAEELTRNADAAMYEAKRKQSGVLLYHPGIEQAEDPAAVLKSELRTALAGNELLLHYQPKFDLGSGKVTEVEALVRWMHPRRGLLLPDAFIPMAEQGGLIGDLTTRVLHMALAQCRLWLDRGISMPVSVNASAACLLDHDFPKEVEQLLQEHKVPAEYLEIEVKENAIMRDPLHAAETINRLNKMGVKVSIEGFGMGYSSYHHLQKLRLAKIKIDRPFINEMDKSKHGFNVVRVLIELGHNLGLKVVAEGIEDQRAWGRLKDMGCDAAQGFYMSKPLTPDGFLESYYGCSGQTPCKLPGESA